LLNWNKVLVHVPNVQGTKPISKPKMTAAAIVSLCKSKKILIHLEPVKTFCYLFVIFIMWTFFSNLSESPLGTLCQLKFKYWANGKKICKRELQRRSTGMFVSKSSKIKNHLIYSSQLMLRVGRHFSCFCSNEKQKFSH
jgi:hypothetical protein